MEMTNVEVRMTNECSSLNVQLGIRHWDFIRHSGLGIGHYFF